MNYDLNKLFEIILAFNREKDYADLLNVILTKMMEMTNADAGTLYIIEDGSLHFRIVRNISLNIFQSVNDKNDKLDLPPIALDLPETTNVCAYTALKNEITSIEDVYCSNRFNFEGPKNYDKITGYRTCSMLTMPMTSTVSDTANVIGVIQLINAIDTETGKVAPFGDISNPPVIPAILNIAANTLANLLHEQETKELLHSFVKVMTQAIDERSSYNSDHTNNVAEYCNRFAEYLSLRFPKEHKFYFSENRREQLVMAALLHDIGKIITPLSIMDKADRLGDQLEIIRYKFEIKKYQLEYDWLSGKLTESEYTENLAGLKDSLAFIEEVNTAGFLTVEKLKRIGRLEALTYTDRSGYTVPLLTPENIKSLNIIKGTLTNEERLIMQEHVSVTGRFLANMKFSKNYQNVRSWAKNHHEFIDGTGYQLGLSGDEVTTEMRILTMMDIYDALTARDRPYKKPIPPDKSLEILMSMTSEGKLDKELVELFIESGVFEVL